METTRIIGAAFGATGAMAALWQGARFCTLPPSPAKSIVKTTAVASLALAGAVLGAPGLIVAGLALGATGDFFLSRPGDNAFLAGMAAFAGGHLAYAAAFLFAGAGTPPPALVLAFLALGASTEFWLAPRAGALRWPVRGYVLVILGMALAAMGLPAGHIVLKAGVLAFLASDLILALATFVLRTPRTQRVAQYALWPLYWCGQALILCASL
jgi:uncharacterized membrane protein YhhN